MAVLLLSVLLDRYSVVCMACQSFFVVPGTCLQDRQIRIAFTFIHQANQEDLKRDKSSPSAFSVFTGIEKPVAVRYLCCLSPVSEITDLTAHFRPDVLLAGFLLNFS